MTMDRFPIAPDRIRKIEGSFAFIPHRFVREGFFQSLTPDELRLYLMLVLVADRLGISFYSHLRLSTQLQMSPQTFLQAREDLMRKDLIAAQGTRVQVLSLPPQPVCIELSPMPRPDQASACQHLLASLDPLK